MKPIRVLVVDDEPLAREMLSAMLERDAELEVAGTAGDGNTAAELIARSAPDIVLMDIEMPERTGLEAVRCLEAERRPFFIFVTAYAQYAAEAFEVEAVDYVLKPVSEKRLSEALERTKSRIRERRLSHVAQKVVSLAEEFSGERGETGETRPGRGTDILTRIPVSVDGRTRFVEAVDIVWIESQDYYVQIHTRQGAPLLRIPLKSLRKRLDPRRFCQVRRGAIVNLEHVVEVQSLFKGAHAVLLSNGKKLRVSRSRWRKVSKILAPSLRP